MLKNLLAEKKRITSNGRGGEQPKSRKNFVSDQGPLVLGPKVWTRATWQQPLLWAGGRTPGVARRAGTRWKIEPIHCVEKWVGSEGFGCPHGRKGRKGNGEKSPCNINNKGPVMENVQF